MPITPRSRFAIAKGITFLSFWTELRKNIKEWRLDCAITILPDILSAMCVLKRSALTPSNRPIKIARVVLAQFDIGNLLFLLLLNERDP